MFNIKWFYLYIRFGSSWYHGTDKVGFRRVLLWRDISVHEFRLHNVAAQSWDFVAVLQDCVASLRSLKIGMQTRDS